MVYSPVFQCSHRFSTVRLLCEPTQPDIQGTSTQRPVSGRECSLVGYKQTIVLVVPSPSHSSHRRVGRSSHCQNDSSSVPCADLHHNLGPLPMEAECAHNQWVLLTLTSLTGLPVPCSNSILSHLSTPRTITDEIMPTGAILRSRMSLPITEKQQIAGGIGYPAHPAFYIA